MADANAGCAGGEELLIVQKEFDGFADTRERLDLLALRQGGPAGGRREQARRLGPRCRLAGAQVRCVLLQLEEGGDREIYQKYLDRWFEGANAVVNLCDFFDVEDLDDMVLNEGNEQRLVLIAANLRKEVTATVPGCFGHGVRAQCFRVVPYSFGDELFIDLQQIIPTPEAADFMIGMAAKDSEEKSVQGARKRSHRLRHATAARRDQHRLYRCGAVTHSHAAPRT